MDYFFEIEQERGCGDEAVYAGATSQRAREMARPDTDGDGRKEEEVRRGRAAWSWMRKDRRGVPR